MDFSPVNFVCPSTQSTPSSHSIPLLGLQRTREGFKETPNFSQRFDSSAIHRPKHNSVGENFFAYDRKDNECHLHRMGASNSRISCKPDDSRHKQDHLYKFKSVNQICVQSKSQKRCYTHSIPYTGLFPSNSDLETELSYSLNQQMQHPRGSLEDHLSYAQKLKQDIYLIRNRSLDRVAFLQRSHIWRPGYGYDLFFFFFF